MNYLQRKLKAFLTSAGGFLKTITGTSSLSYTDCISVVNLSVSGKSTQSGAPTPSNPIPVTSVGDYDSVSDQYIIPFTYGANTAQITLDKPLYKVGNYADRVVIDYDNRTAKRINRTAEYALNTENFNYTGGALYTNGTCRAILNKRKNMLYGAVLCDELKGYNNTLNTSAYSISSMSTYGAIYIYLNNSNIGEETPSSVTYFDSNSTQITAFINFVKDFTTYVPLDTETEEDVTSQIDWNSIPSGLTGTVTLTATSSTTPSAMSSDYYSTTP